jgi:hypothetical protein
MKFGHPAIIQTSARQQTQTKMNSDAVERTQNCDCLLAKFETLNSLVTGTLHHHFLGLFPGH